MKKRIIGLFFNFLLVNVLVLSSCGPAAEGNRVDNGIYTPPSYTLSEALAQGLIKVDVKGHTSGSLGGVSSGDVIVIEFLRQLQEIIEIVVPQGATFISTDPDKQNMVIYRLKGRSPSMSGYDPADQIILTNDDWQKFLFEAYCLDMHKDNIFSSTTFTVGDVASPQIVAMLAAAEELKADITAIQVAIWVLNDDPTREELQKRFQTNDTDIHMARIILDSVNLDARSKKLFADLPFSEAELPSEATLSVEGGWQPSAAEEGQIYYFKSEDEVDDVEAKTIEEPRESLGIVSGHPEIDITSAHTRLSGDDVIFWIEVAGSITDNIHVQYNFQVTTDPDQESDVYISYHNGSAYYHFIKFGHGEPVSTSNELVPYRKSSRTLMVVVPKDAFGSPEIWDIFAVTYDGREWESTEGRTYRDILRSY